MHEGDSRNSLLGGLPRSSHHVNIDTVHVLRARERGPRPSPLCALSISLAFSPGRRKPVEAQTVHFRFSRPALLDAHWPPRCPAALPLATVGSECPFSRQRMGAGAMADPTRGYWSISLSEKPAKWDLVCARGVSARDLPGTSRGCQLSGKAFTPYNNGGLTGLAHP